MEFETRPDTTDQKVIDEVIKRNVYERKKDNFFLKDAPIWLDLGGNIGTFTCKACNSGCKKVISFEPEIDNFNLLKRNIKKNNFSKKVTPIRAGVVAQENIKELKLYLCKGNYNKYRHTIFKKRGRQSIKIPVQNFKKILKKYRPNGIKIDIEGAEIEILESMKPSDWPKHVTHLVFEYTFDVDPSVDRFRKIIENLKQNFEFVHHKKMSPDLKEYKFWPPCVNVFCKKL